MKKALIAACFLLLSAGSFAGNRPLIMSKDSTWQGGGTLTLTFNQVSLTNWAAGGSNSVALSGLLTPYLNFKSKDARFHWDNNLILAYGVVKNYNSGKFNQVPFIKSDDRIDYTSKLGKYAFKHWYYSAILNFRTQFAPGYSDPLTQLNKTSDFLNASRTLFGLGMDYKPKPFFALFVSPITANWVTVADTFYAKFNGILPGLSARKQFGAYLNATFKKDLDKDKKTNLQTTLGLFSDYLNNPQNVQVNWQAVFSYKPIKFLTIQLSTQVLADNITKIPTYDQTGTIIGYGPKTQFKQTLGIGFSYKF